MKYLLALGLVVVTLVGFWVLPDGEALSQAFEQAEAPAPLSAALDSQDEARRPSVDRVEQTEGTDSGPLSDPVFTAGLCRFHGRVIDEDGAGVPGITVRVRRRHPDISINGHREIGAALAITDVGSGITDTQGRFSVENIWPCGISYDLELVDKHGRAETSSCKVTPGVGETGEVGDLLWKPSGSLIGKVSLVDYPSGTAMQIRVLQGGTTRDWSVYEHGVRRSQETVSGWARGDEFVRLVPLEADGSFAIRGLAPGKASLIVYREGDYPACWWDGLVESGETRDLGTLAPATGRIEGRVVDSMGRPVIGADLLAADLRFPGPVVRGGAMGRMRLTQRGFPVGVTDAEGRFSIAGIHSSKVRLAVRRGPGQAWTVFPDLPLDRHHSLQLPQEYTLDLVLRDDHGSPIDTEVEWTILPMDQLGGRFGLPLFCPPTDRELKLESWIEKIATGHWRVTNLPRAQYSLMVRLPQWGKSDVRIIRLIENHTETIVCDRSRSLRVTVLNLAGVPIEHARVVTSGGSESTRLWGLTDAEGQVEAGASTGYRKFRLEISHPAYEAAGQDIARGTNAVTVTLGKTARIEGQVIIDGTPFDPLKFRLGLHKLGMKDPEQLRVDEQLAFSSPKLEPGQYDLVLMKRNTALHWKVEPTSLKLDEGMQEGQVLTIMRRADVPVPGTVSGAVVLNGTGNASTVSLTVNGAVHLVDVDSRDGSFDFGELSVGRHMFRVGGHRTVHEQVVEVRSGEASVIDLNIRTGKIRGTIVGLEPSMQVRLMREGSLTPLSIVSPDRFGRFELEAGFGKFYLVAGRHDRWTGVLRPTAGLATVVVDGSNANQDLKLESRSCVPVRWTLPAEVLSELKGETGVTVWFFGPTCGQMSVDEHGLATSRDKVFPGSYRVYVATGFSRDLEKMNVSAWQAPPAQLRFVASAVVVGNRGSEQVLSLSPVRK